MFIEPLGGVMTPCFTGLPQAEVYRPLGFPVVFVGSSAFNGVSLTISAFESLELRGYNAIALVVFKEERWKNYRYLDQYFRRRHPSVRVVMLPEPPSTQAALDVEVMEPYYSDVYNSGALSPLISSLGTVYQ